MLRQIVAPLFIAAMILAPRLAAADPDKGLVGVTVVIENLAPSGGTWLAPVWVGFHDGGFDAYNLGDPASAALERLAEDGATEALAGQFTASGRGAAQGTLAAAGEMPQIAPGESATKTFVLNATDPSSRFFSWASMVLPSNDAFIAGDDPQGLRVFDNSGNFQGAYRTIPGSAVLDAGTEVNDELPANTAFFGQTVPDSGDPENGVVHAHPGFLPPGSGGILDDPEFGAADFTVTGYQMARITLYRSDTILAGGEVSGTWDVSGSPYIVQGNLTVPENASLTVDPGVVVYTEGGKSLNVQGNLRAIGTADQPILFTGDRDENSSGAGWQGIVIENGILASRLEYCTVEYGDRNSTYESGGGIACHNASLELVHTTLKANTAYLNGAAVEAVDANLLVQDCDIFQNHISGQNSGAGGGIYAENCEVEITDSRIHDNTVHTFTYFGATNSRGGGIAMIGSSGLVAGNLIYGNDLNHSGTLAASEGGGIYVDGGGPTIRGNTIIDNQVHYNNHNGGGIYLRGYFATLVDNIVAGNVGAGVWFDGGAETTEVSFGDYHANTEGDFGGGYLPAQLGQVVRTNANGDPCDAFDNIFLDPLFVSPNTDDFHLQPGSPCIDAGDPDSPTDPDGTVADQGALFSPQATSGVRDPGPHTVVALQMGNSPEPMSGSTTIRYRLPAAGQVRLTVYDLHGRAVRTLVNGYQPQGERSIPFDGRDDRGRALASGMYFYRLTADGLVTSRKVTILH